MDSCGRPSVLVVDDEMPNLDTFRRVFRHDFDLQLAESGEHALELMTRQEFEIALVDYAMPGMNGVEFLRQARARQPEMGRVMVTAYGELADVREALASGLSAAVIVKPWEKTEVVKWVKHFSKLALMRRAVDRMKTMMTKRPAD